MLIINALITWPKALTLSSRKGLSALHERRTTVNGLHIL